MLSVVSPGELLAEPSRAGADGAVLPSAAITASAALKTARWFKRFSLDRTQSSGAGIKCIPVAACSFRQLLHLHPLLRRANQILLFEVALGNTSQLALFV